MTLQTATQSLRPVLDRTKLTGLKELIGEAKCNAAIQRFKAELFACLAAIEGNAPERAVHAHNLAGVAALLGFEDLEDKSRRFLVALHENKEDVRPSAEIPLGGSAERRTRTGYDLLIQLYGEAGSLGAERRPASITAASNIRIGSEADVGNVHCNVHLVPIADMSVHSRTVTRHALGKPR